MKKREKPKYGAWSNCGFMIRTAWKVRKGVLLTLLAVIALTLLQEIVKLHITPKVLERIETSASFEEMMKTVLLFCGGLAIITALLRYFKQDSKTINTNSGRTQVRQYIRGLVNKKAGITSFCNVRDPKAQKLLASAMNTTENAWQPAELIWSTMFMLAGNLFMLVYCLGLMKELNWWIALVFLGVTAVNYFVSRRLNLWSYYHREEEAHLHKKLTYMSNRARSIPLAKDMRIFGLGNWFSDIYDSMLRMYTAFINRKEKAYMAVCALDTVALLLRTGVAYGYLISLAISKAITVSEFVLYFNVFSLFSITVSNTLISYNTLHRQSLELSKLREYLEYPEPFTFEEGETVPKTEAYELRLDNVSFKYPGSEIYIFQNLNLTIKPKEKLAVVGLNGAGKTTLVNLLCGFYDPDEGRVLLNGVDIRQYNRREYYALISAVFQNYALMDVTLRENVSMGDTDPDLERILGCLEQAGLKAFVQSLSKGLDTHIGREVVLDGMGLSGGQEQRLLLARALYKNGPILILDEPTAALDPLAESDIYNRYDQMTQGKTALFISHRLASTRFCERIILLEAGKIAEEGTHEQLLERKGKYAELFEIQSRYYQEGGASNEKFFG